MTFLNTPLIRKLTLFLAAVMLSLSAMATDSNQVHRLANQGNSYAQYSLGRMYYKGEAVRENTSLAKEWFGKSCDNGNQNGCDIYRMLNEQGY